MMATESEFLDTFRENLRKLVKAEDVPVAGISKESGVNPLVIWNLIGHKEKIPIPSAYTVYALSVYFGVSVDEMIL